MEELEKYLVKSGYKIYDNNPLKSQYNEITWYAAKRTKSKRECESNKKPVQIIVSPYRTIMRHGVHESVTVDLTAEYMGVWWKLEAYSLSVKIVMTDLPQIEKRLVSAWEAL
jgi:hypothetical protein